MKNLIRETMRKVLLEDSGVLDLDTNNLSIPNEVYLNGIRYSGEVGFIQGNNGYSRTENDGLMAAIVNNSLWDKDGKENLLKTSDGKFVKSTRKSNVTHFID